MEQYIVTGMSCAACSARVEKAVSSVEGVDSCSVSLLTNSMGVEGTARPEDIIAAVEKAGYGASRKLTTDKKSAVSHAEEEAMLEDKETPLLKKRLISSLVFLAMLMYISMGHMMFGWKLPAFMDGNHVAMGLTQMLLTIVIMVINQKFFRSGFTSLMHGAPNMDTLVALGASAAFIYSTYALYAMSWAQVEGDADKVMSFMDEFYFESAAMILTLITVGKMLEARSKGKTTDALKGLMRLAPKTAVVVRDGAECEVPVEDVNEGDIFVVRPGDNIPVDGVVVEGYSAVNEAALTGESIPVDKQVGDSVSAATINQSGFMKCQAVRVGEDTTLSQIIRMVQDAAATKAPIAKVADKVSGIFVPTVITLAVITTVAWLLLGREIGFALARGISVLVISCPCALGLATPVAIMVGNGVGARHGILYKTAASLEAAGRVRMVALDKTGTITKGEPKVTDVIPAEKVTEKELVELACALEDLSEHPLAHAVIEYGRSYLKNRYDRVLDDDSVDEFCTANNNDTMMDSSNSNEMCDGQDICALNEHLGKVTDFQALPGNGLKGRWKGADIYGGNAAFISRVLLNGKGEINTTSDNNNPSIVGKDIAVEGRIENTLSDDIRNKLHELSSQGKTPLLFARNDTFMGIIAVADVIREDSCEAIACLKDMGIKVVMITGDNEESARAIGEQAGVSEVIAGVLPDGKESRIRELMEQGKTAMVGDGINDAPALTRADVGIAIGAGTDIAMDAADVVLMKSSLMDVVDAVTLGRATLRNIHENLFWAFIYNVIGIPLAAGVWIPLFGWQLNPMFGAAAMSLSSFCVVTNALRLNLVKLHGKTEPETKEHIDKANADGRKLAMDSDYSESNNAQMNNPKKSGNDNIHLDETNNNNDERNNIINKEDIIMSKTMKIEGMMCGHCEATVKKALEAIDGVAEAVVSHEKGTAEVSLSAEVADDVLKKAVEDKDYTVVSVA
ncbi:MAG: heavy metal translocating P-type ATPase [Lachnospiraceae bacterium]|nr:heavy metal translocating P-type ATPase [Lachnospiraceae bacterium]